MEGCRGLRPPAAGRHADESGGRRASLLGRARYRRMRWARTWSGGRCRSGALWPLTLPAQAPLGRRGRMSEPHTTIDPRFSDPGVAPTPWEETRRALEAAELSWITTVRSDGR